MSLYDVLIARKLAGQGGGGGTGGIETQQGTATETTITFPAPITDAGNKSADIYLIDLMEINGQLEFDESRKVIVAIRYDPSDGVRLAMADKNGITQNMDAYGAETLEWGADTLTLQGELQVDTGAILAPGAGYKIVY